jgi:hypothetical protein
MCHPHTSLSGSEKEMSGGNYKKTTESISYAATAFGASMGSEEKITQRAQRNGAQRA